MIMSNQCIPPAKGKINTNSRVPMQSSADTTRGCLASGEENRNETQDIRIALHIALSLTAIFGLGTSKNPRHQFSLIQDGKERKKLQQL